MLLNIYKPKNWTSFDVVAKLRGILGIKKIGHAGTLDPLAEGVLIVLTEGDTKKQDELMHRDKEYKAKIAFKIDSPTYDLEGPVEFLDHAPTKEQIINCIPKFIGDIEQTVPPYSAVKVKGKPLYKMARRNELSEAELPVKKVKIFSIDIMDFKDEPVEVNSKSIKLPVLTCIVKCSSGTYIRSLAHDLGGVLVELIRTRVGEFRIEDAVRLEDLKV